MRTPTVVASATVGASRRTFPPSWAAAQVSTVMTTAPPSKNVWMLPMNGARSRAGGTARQLLQRMRHRLRQPIMELLHQLPRTSHRPVRRHETLQEPYRRFSNRCLGCGLWPSPCCSAPSPTRRARHHQWCRGRTAGPSAPGRLKALSTRWPCPCSSWPSRGTAPARSRLSSTPRAGADRARASVSSARTGTAASRCAASRRRTPGLAAAGSGSAWPWGPDAAGNSGRRCCVTSRSRHVAAGASGTSAVQWTRTRGRSWCSWTSCR
mmetsp:Transcript_88411/g.245450  ORF Transcript_88411/g.245450 Transcript_88411/m.245450 type:complete len:266 (-) Transcript_88411:190-987(-)